jgi:hypothetical protein
MLQQRERTAPAPVEVKESRLLHLSRWSPGNLMLGWSTYWAALILVVLAPIIPALWRLSRSEGHGNASVSIGDGALEIVVNEGLSHIWKLDIGLTAAALAVAIPPLLLWALWLRAQRRGPAPKPTD